MYGNQRRVRYLLPCPYCGQPMEHGQASVLPMQGMDMMSLTHRSDSEHGNRSYDVILTAGSGGESFCCPQCRVIVPLLKG